MTRHRGLEVHFSYYTLQVLVLSITNLFVSLFHAPTNQPPAKTDSALPEFQSHKTPRPMSPYKCVSWISVALKLWPFIGGRIGNYNVGYVDGL